MCQEEEDQIIDDDNLLDQIVASPSLWQPFALYGLRDSVRANRVQLTLFSAPLESIQTV
jgi:hypothetical protein